MISEVSSTEDRTEDLLHHQRVPVLGNKRSCHIGTVEIAMWNRSIFERGGRVQVIRVSMFLNQFLRHNPENLSPDFSNCMHAPVSWLVKSLVGRRVDSLILIDHLARLNVSESITRHTKEYM